MSEDKEYIRCGETEIAWLKKHDKRLGRAIDRIGPIRREPDGGLFSAVLHHIIGQQISAKAQKTVWTRLCARLGEVSADTVCSAGLAALQACGTTFRKAEYMLDFANRVKTGAFDTEAIEKMNDTDAISALTALNGIGVWTAEMILLFSLQRPNILSFGDLAILRGMRMLYRHREIDRSRFERYRKRFSPYCSAASLYFWAIGAGALPELNDPAQYFGKKGKPE